MFVFLVPVAVPTVTVGKGIISSRRTVAATAVDEVFVLIGKVGAGGGEDAASQQACLLL